MERFEIKWLEQFLNPLTSCTTHVGHFCENSWAPGHVTQRLKCDRIVSLIPRRRMQIVWVYTGIKAITSSPVQEPRAREWTLQVFGFQFFLLLFMPNTAHKSICFLSRRFSQAWSSFTKSHLCCAIQFINPELSFGMKTPFKNSVISTLTALLVCKIFLSLHHRASVKRNRISISGFYWPQPLITQKDAWDPAVKTLEWWYL